MFRLNHVDPKDATGKVKEAYGVFPPQVPVPVPMQMLSVSPGLLEAASGIMRHYMSQESLSHPLKTLIRFLVSCHTDYGFCVDFNGALLKQAGMTDEDLARVQKDPAAAPIEDHERAMLLYVLKAVKDPKSVGDENIAELRKMGWKDSQIMDALYLGATMVANRIANTALIDPAPAG